MATTLTIRDETPSGTTTGEFTLDLLTESITVRELIRSRVYQEVKDYNCSRPDRYGGLVQPTRAERDLNGSESSRNVGPKGGLVDWRLQYDKAIDAFRAGRILVLVGDEQVGSLEDTIEVSPSTRVSFVKLVPLVGG